MGDATMHNRVLYFDWASTTPLFSAVKEEMLRCMQLYGNSSSTHQLGRLMRSEVETARAVIADSLGVLPSQVVFTSGGTEANALVMRHFHGKKAFCSAIEHASVLNWVPKAYQLPVDQEGFLAIENVLEQIEKEKPALVAVMAANNEVGAVQPLSTLVQSLEKMAEKPWVHVDAVQFYGKESFSFDSLGCDSLAITAHKIGGPVGIGALVLKEGEKLSPLMRGGGQEMGRRPGTLNVQGIMGFAAAVKSIKQVDWGHVSALRETLEERVKTCLPDVMFHGPCRGMKTERFKSVSLPHISCFSHPHLSGVEQVMALDLEGICVSAGSACSSGKMSQSHVLAAMGIPAEKAIRVSLGWETTLEQIEKFVAVYTKLFPKKVKE